MNRLYIQINDEMRIIGRIKFISKNKCLFERNQEYVTMNMLPPLVIKKEKDLAIKKRNVV
jgi:hypothetical protein